MSETPADSTETGRDEDDLHGGGQGQVGEGDEAMMGGADGGADAGSDAGAKPVSGLAEGDDVSTGTDGVGGGNDSRSSVLEDTLGAGGDPDGVDHDQ